MIQSKYLCHLQIDKRSITLKHLVNHLQITEIEVFQGLILEAHMSNNKFIRYMPIN